MQTTKKNALILALVLSLALWLTRGNHIVSISSLPDASWAIFFLVGFYFSSPLAFIALLAQAGLIDYLTIGQLVNEQASIFTLSYIMLVPAYLCMTLAGKWLAKIKLNVVHTIQAVLVGVIGCEIISSGSFYLLSGSNNVTMDIFFSLFAQQLPLNLTFTSIYLAVAAFAHFAIKNAGLKYQALKG